jgi:hypothetical protein
MFSAQRSTYWSRAIVPPLYQHSWKRHMQKALRENDPDKLVHFVYATELALFFRWQELAGQSSEPERAAMRSAADNLLAIKIYKLGWPPIPQGVTR